MKRLNKLNGLNQLNHYATRLSALLLLPSLLWIAGCATPYSHTDPLVGFHFASLNPNEALVSDYKNYIQGLSSEESKSAGPIHYFTNDAGEQAIMITIGINNRVWRHVLIYDKDNKRIKTIKYVSGDYFS